MPTMAEPCPYCTTDAPYAEHSENCETYQKLLRDAVAARERGDGCACAHAIGARGVKGPMGSTPGAVPLDAPQRVR